MPPTLTHGSQVWTLKRGTTTVGRQDTCEIVIADRSLSRAHATLEVERNSVEIRDNNSSNGTFVNNVRIASEELHDGDLVRFGNMDCVFNWPESVIQVSVSPISQDQAQKIGQQLTKKSENTTDWKASLATVAAIGAIGTGIVAGVIGAFMGRDALLAAIMVGAVGGIATSLIVKSVTEKRVASSLTDLKDNLDLFFGGQTDDVPLPKGFPELVEVVHSIRLGSNIVKDRTANSWRMKLHEMQMELEAIQAVDSTNVSDRGFNDPLLAMDSSYRIHGWNAHAKALFKPEISTISGIHLLEAMHSMELGSHLIGVLNGLQPGQQQVIPNPGGQSVSILAIHASGGPKTHEYLLLFLS